MQLPVELAGEISTDGIASPKILDLAHQRDLLALPDTATADHLELVGGGQGSSACTAAVCMQQPIVVACGLQCLVHGSHAPPPHGGEPTPANQWLCFQALPRCLCAQAGLALAGLSQGPRAAAATDALADVWTVLLWGIRR